MKLGNLPEKPLNNLSAGPNKPADGAAASVQSTDTAAAAQTASVAVKLSAVTQTMTNGVARSGTDVFNAEKVEAMRAAIANGSFSVNAEAIADKLLGNAREMLSVASASSGNDRSAPL